MRLDALERVKESVGRFENLEFEVIVIDGRVCVVIGAVPGSALDLFTSMCPRYKRGRYGAMSLWPRWCTRQR